MRALVRWAGSKRHLLRTLKGRVPAFEGRYVEPFAGSACLFFALEPSIGLLSDLNHELIQAYRVVRRSPRKVWSMVTSLEASKDTYYSLRSADPAMMEPLERSVRFLYLNRLCFNGVYRTNKNGEFNVPMGRNTGAFPGLKIVSECAKLLRRAQLASCDFEVTLQGVKPGDFVYLDPPYFKQGRRAYGEYGYGRFDKSDLERLSSVLNNVDAAGAKFLLSYTAAQSDKPHFARWNVDRVEAQRHVAGFTAGRAKVIEVLVSNY